MMKYNSIEGIARWYENRNSWEVVKERAFKEWREEIQMAYKAGVEMGEGNRNRLRKRLEDVYKGLIADIETPMSSEDWFKNNWE